MQQQARLENKSDAVSKGGNGISADLINGTRRLGALLNEPEFQMLRAQCRPAIARWAEVERMRLLGNRLYHDAVYSRMYELRGMHPSWSATEIYETAQGMVEIGLGGQLPIELTPQLPAIPFPVGQPIDADHVLLIVAGLHDLLLTNLEAIGPQFSKAPACGTATEHDSDEALYWCFVQRAFHRLTLLNLTDLETCLLQLAKPPNWNRDTGVLTVGGKVAKRIKNLGQARNVVLVLDTFEQSQWPERIDDPLEYAPERKRINRLGETVKSLNDHIVGIRFVKDGTTQGIRWERD